VPAQDLPSAVRLNATARTLGVLVGPAVGGAIMLTVGPRWGLVLNAFIFLPAVLWLWKAPYGPKFRREAAPPPRAVKGLADITRTIAEVKSDRLLVSMILLAGCASFLVGNSYQAQMPGFAHDLGHGDPGATYSMLLAADAAGALTAGLLLEMRGGWLPTTPLAAIVMAMLWCVSLAAFAATASYPFALVLLFAAGVCELAFSSIAMTLVQLHAPAASRGRVIGLFNMSALGLRAFAGVTVGLTGAAVGIHGSLIGASLALLVVLSLLTYWMTRRR
jgi:MFS family permease